MRSSVSVVDVMVDFSLSKMCAITLEWFDDTVKKTAFSSR